MKWFVFLAALALCGVASGELFSDEHRLDFKVFPESGELRVAGDGVAEFLLCNTTCHLEWNTTYVCATSNNLSEMEYGLHKLIADVRDDLLEEYNESCPDCVCDCNSSNFSEQSLNKFFLNHQNWEMNELFDRFAGYALMNVSLAECRVEKAKAIGDALAKQSDVTELEKERDELKSENGTLGWYLIVTISVIGLLFLWIQGILPQILGRGG